MIKSALSAAVLALFASASMAASTYDVSFDAIYDGSTFMSGSFEGTDTNHDGLLSLGEITSFAASGSGYNIGTSNLAAFGTFDTATDTWNANATAWAGQTNQAFFSWNGGTNAITSIFFTVPTTIDSVTTPVPEPTSLAMMGLGALALAARRKRKSA